MELSGAHRVEQGRGELRREGVLFLVIYTNLISSSRFKNSFSIQVVTYVWIVIIPLYRNIANGVSNVLL